MASTDATVTGMTRTGSQSGGISTRSKTITAFFDTKGAAQKAIDDLVAAGIPRENIKITEGAGTNATASTSVATEDKSFWDELKDLFMPDEDRYGYAEGLRRGGYLLAVRVDEADYNRAIDILDTDGAVNMDEREASWRSEGWTGYQGGSLGNSSSGLRSSAAGTPPSSVGTTPRAPATDPDALTGTRNTGAAGAKVDTLESGRDEVIPVYEETAQVAKREVNHGRVRIRSYVVETPISEQVNLRSESVQVERRPVDRAVSASDAPFQDRVIEAEEHIEEAVITKQARVTEEISLRKTVENQAQTVSDTVRRTQVEIEDERGGRTVGNAPRFAAAADSSKITPHMDVIGSDGTKIGTVDHLDGPDKIKLAKNTSPDGQHHSVPLTWVDHVDTHVHLNKTLADIKAGR